MKNLDYTTIETALPAEAMKLLDRFGETCNTSRQELIEIAVMHYLYDRRTSSDKQFKKDVKNFCDEWNSADEVAQAA
ncbi:hypothetical protein R75471_07250 [Paraburkholderia domus]|uniref:hypothetical protein n=1 Tax=Paraburkholderia domus TaxID=2793075 RepID=UPI001B2564F8|nr:hypothetical protein [Paraburkholderia domus]CAE6968359.1 hypothetical protein R75471_07250 [Paraburkholderia domus]